MTSSHARQDDSTWGQRIGDWLLSRLGPLLILVAVMWVVRIVDAVIPENFNKWGLRSWEWDSIWGIFTSPFLHGGWIHLISNTIPMLILGGLVAASGRRIFAFVTLSAMIIGGLGVFFVNSPGTLTVGASGLVFGYFGYLVVAGFFEESLRGKLVKLGVAALVLVTWGIPMLIGLLPIRVGISWQGHLFGMLGGMAAAALMARTQRRRDDDLPDGRPNSLPR